jgi:hypothetical protein
VPRGGFGFELWIDSVLQEPDYQSTWISDNFPPGAIVREWVYNYPAGMAGEHTFTGRWLAPCLWAVEYASYPDPCETPNAKVVFHSREVVVDFVD